jgi:hypothetical protein
VIFSLLECIQAKEVFNSPSYSITFLKDSLTSCKSDHLKEVTPANITGEGTSLCTNRFISSHPSFVDKHLFQERHVHEAPNSCSGCLYTTQGHLDPTMTPVQTTQAGKECHIIPRAWTAFQKG